MIPFLKVIHVDNENIPTDLSAYVISLTINKGSEATKNSLNIELQNHNGELNSQNFTIDESTILAYLAWEPITLGSDGFPTIDPMISSFVSSVSYPQDTNGKYKIKLKCTDKTGLFLSKVWAYAYVEADNWDAPSIIKHVCQGVDELSNNATKYINGSLSLNNVDMVKPDGSAFKKPIALSKIWKPAYEWLNDLSSPTYTGSDRSYVYYVDANNDLHWTYPFQKNPISLTSAMGIGDTSCNVTSTASYPPSGNIMIDDEAITYTGKTPTSFTGLLRGQYNTSTTTHSSGTTVSGDILTPGRQDVYSIDIGTTEDSVYNMIIYNAGKTPAGYDYLWYALDYSQAGRSFRMKFFDWAAIGEDMTNREKAGGDWADKEASYPSSYPYTTQWGVTVADDDEYQDEFLIEVKKRGQSKAESYFHTGRQKYTASVQMRGTTQYTVNELVSVYHPKFDTTQLLRVKSVKHQLNKGSWVTTLDMETDPLPDTTAIE